MKKRLKIPAKAGPSSQSNEFLWDPKPLKKKSVVISTLTHQQVATIRPVKFVYDAGPHPVEAVNLKASLNAKGEFDEEWSAGEIPMRSKGDGVFEVVVPVRTNNTQKWEWGATVDTADQKNAWAVFGEDNLTFDPKHGVAGYAPTTYHRMGAFAHGSKATAFRVWAPNAKKVELILQAPGQPERSAPMELDSEGMWRTVVPESLKSLVGTSHFFRLVNSEGETVERSDLYSRAFMGVQLGTATFHYDKDSAVEVNRYNPAAHRVQQFEVELENATDAWLVLQHDDGTPLSADEVKKLQTDVSSNWLQEVDKNRQRDDNALKCVEEDGRVHLKPAGGAFTTWFSNPDALVGLRYRFDVQTANGIVPFKDRWSDKLAPMAGIDPRRSVITDPSAYVFKNDAVPRVTDLNKMLVYQLHVGSFLGAAQNGKRSNLTEIAARIAEIKALGFTHIETLPLNQPAGVRNWAYDGNSTRATNAAYGCIDDNGNELFGVEALKSFVDAVHGEGMGVVFDVVYNHVGGDFNPMENYDGAQDIYFRRENGELVGTPWGNMPAYGNSPVSQFVVDDSVAQMEELHSDGLRWDFTGIMKDLGGQSALDVMRNSNRQVHFWNVNAKTIAEQFPYDPTISRPADKGTDGAGFDLQWYTEYFHRLIHDNAPFHPGLLQAAANGWKIDTNAFLQMFETPLGLDGFHKALTVVSNHDEVGGGERIVRTAQGQNPEIDQWARSAARMCVATAFLSPGTPIMFQGDENQAENKFSWGIFSTWDNDLAWETEQTVEANSQRGAARMLKEVLSLRASSDAFDADACTTRVHSNDDESMLAFSRSKGDESFVVVANFSKDDKHGYSIELPPGQWKEVLNTDSSTYGGRNVGNGGATFSSENAALTLPAGGALVFQRVG